MKVEWFALSNYNIDLIKLQFKTKCLHVSRDHNFKLSFFSIEKYINTLKKFLTYFLE